MSDREAEIALARSSAPEAIGAEPKGPGCGVWGAAKMLRTLTAGRETERRSQAM